MLLICYTAGARGDFLASVLLNRRFKNKLIIDTPRGYRKIHWINDGRHRTDFNLDPADLPGYTSIRICANTDLDIIKLIHRRYSKPQLYTEPNLERELSSCLEQEERNRAYNSQFNYLVPIEMFDNIQKIESFYRQINGYDMDPGLRDLAIANIELNDCRGKHWKNLSNQFKHELHNYPWPSWIQRVTYL